MTHKVDTRTVISRRPFAVKTPASPPGPSSPPAPARLWPRPIVIRRARTIYIKPTCPT